MNDPTPLWSSTAPCSQVITWLSARFSQLDLTALRTFDLHDARSAGSGCECPHHGTSACDCQMVVLLVYSAAHPPATLVVHGSNGKTWVSIVDRPDQRPNPGTLQMIKRALEGEVLAAA